MKNTVTIKLEDYVVKLEKISELTFKFKEEERTVRELQDDINRLHDFLLEQNVLVYLFDKYTLEQLLDDKSLFFGMNKKDSLLELGITLEEMKEFIKESYEKVHGL